MGETTRLKLRQMSCSCSAKLFLKRKKSAMKTSLLFKGVGLSGVCLGQGMTCLKGNLQEPWTKHFHDILESFMAHY